MKDERTTRPPFSHKKDFMAKRPLYVASSDWHGQIGAWTQAPANRITGDSYFALKQIVDLCIELEVPLLAAGDLLDCDRPDSSTLREIFQQIDYLKAAKLPLLFTQGQHEKAYPAYLSLHDWPTHLHGDTASYALPGYKYLYFHGLDHHHADHLQEALKKIPENTGVLLCHQVWSNFMGVGCEGSLEMIPHAATVITGDYHKHLKIKVTGATGQEMTVLSPGATCLQDITEPAEHFAWVAYDDGTFESHKLKSRHVFDVGISAKPDLDAFL